jgi:5'-nucleotidase
MASDRSKTLVVGVTSTALFDLAQVDRRFREAHQADPDTAIEEYRATMRATENEPLADGPGMPVVRALLGLNANTPPGEAPLVEVVIMSRNSPETGVRVLHAIRRSGLTIERSAFTGGEAIAPLLQAYGVDLFLTTDVADAQRAIDSRACAAAILRGAQAAPPADARVRIAFDGDAVLFDESSELVYKKHGVDAFHDNEASREDEPLEDGPYAALLRKLSMLQDRLPTRVEYSPVRISLVTARTAPSDIRVIKTLRNWGVYVDEAYFLGNLKKAAILEVLNPHIFFDDQDLHLDDAAKVVPSGKVPYASGSPLAVFVAEKKARDAAPEVASSEPE